MVRAPEETLADLRQRYEEVYYWEDAAGHVYDPHAHAWETALVILEGWMEISIDGVSRRYAVGDRLIIPAGKEHAAEAGPSGCAYAVGERRIL